MRYAYYKKTHVKIVVGLIRSVEKGLSLGFVHIIIHMLIEISLQPQKSLPQQMGFVGVILYTLHQHTENENSPFHTPSNKQSLRSMKFGNFLQVSENYLAIIPNEFGNFGTF